MQTQVEMSAEPGSKEARNKDGYSHTASAPYAPHRQPVSSKGIQCHCNITWRTLYDILVLMLLLYCSIGVSYLLHQHISQSCVCQYSSSSPTEANPGMYC